MSKHDTGCSYGKSVRNSTELTETLEKYWYSANYSLDSPPLFPENIYFLLDSRKH